MVFMPTNAPPPPDPAWADRDFLLAYEKLHAQWRATEEAASAAQRRLDAQPADPALAQAAQALRESAQAQLAQLLRMLRDRPI